MNFFKLNSFSPSYFQVILLNINSSSFLNLYPQVLLQSETHNATIEMHFSSLLIACVAVHVAAAQTPTTPFNGVTTPVPFEPGMVTNCESFTLVVVSEIPRASPISSDS